MIYPPLSFRLIKTKLSYCDQYMAGNSRLWVCSRLEMHGSKVACAGGLLNESEYRLLHYCEIELLLLMSFNKCDASIMLNMMLYWTGYREEHLYLENHAIYQHRTFTSVLCWGPAHSTDIRIIALETSWRHSYSNYGEIHRPIRERVLVDIQSASFSVSWQQRQLKSGV